MHVNIVKPVGRLTLQFPKLVGLKGSDEQNETF